MGHSITCAAASSVQPGEVVSDPVTAGKAPVTVTAAAKSSKYGKPLADLEYSVSGSYVAGDKLDISLSTTATESSDAGEYPITVTPGNNPNYDVTPEGGIYTIEKITWTKTQAAMSVKRGGSGDADLAARRRRRRRHRRWRRSKS